MSALLALALAAAPGCPAALAAAASTPDAALAARAPALVAALEEGGAGPTGALAAAARAMDAGHGAAQAAAGFRRALARHCALAAAPREPEASAADRAALAEILARPELSGSRLDRWALRRALARWWDWLVERLGTAEAERYASLGRALFLGAAVAAAALAFTGMRRRRRVAREAREAALDPVRRTDAAPDGAAARADEALRRGDAREAVRLALLAALGALERAGRIPRGRALTNDEVIALLGASTPRSSSSSSSSSSSTSTPGSGSGSASPPPPPPPPTDLAVLVRTFDRAVYGGLPVTPDDARAALERSRRVVGAAGGPA
jgi:hypothetical protein